MRLDLIFPWQFESFQLLLPVLYIDPPSSLLFPHYERPCYNDLIRMREPWKWNLEENYTCSGTARHIKGPTEKKNFFSLARLTKPSPSCGHIMSVWSANTVYMIVWIWTYSFGPAALAMEGSSRDGYRRKPYKVLSYRFLFAPLKLLLLESRSFPLA